MLLQLIIDPACSIVFEAEPPAAGLMARPPRRPADSPFAPRNLWRGLLQGSGAAAILLIACWAMVWRGWDGTIVRTMAFLALVGGVLLMALAHRASSNAAAAAEGNRWLPRLILAVFGVLVLLLAFPWVRQILGFGLPAVSQWTWLPVIWVGVAAWLLLVARKPGR